jgi:hypothetical protein
MVPDWSDGFLGPHEYVHLHWIGFGKAGDSAGDAIASGRVAASRRHNQAEFRNVQIEPILKLVHRECGLMSAGPEKPRARCAALEAPAA